MGSGEALVASGICGQYDDLGKVESKVLGINGVVSAIERYRIEAEGRSDVEIGSVVEAGGITGMVGSIEKIYREVREKGQYGLALSAKKQQADLLGYNVVRSESKNVSFVNGVMKDVSSRELMGIIGGVREGKIRVIEDSSKNSSKACSKDSSVAEETAEETIIS